MSRLESIDILLVEDNPYDLELAVRALKSGNVTNRVVVARDGAEALEALFGGRDGGLPRLVLLDLKLPKVDGLEVLRRIREDRRTRSLPVAVLTSSAEEKDLVESYRLGVNSCIVKPVDFGKFTDTVRQVGYYWLVVNRPAE